MQDQIWTLNIDDSVIRIGKAELQFSSHSGCTPNTNCCPMDTK